MNYKIDLKQYDYLCIIKIKKFTVMKKVFYGKLPEPSDFYRKEEQVQTCWAVISRDADGSIDIDNWDFGKLRKIAKEVIQFKEGDLIGWKLKGGSIVVPAWFDQVELCKYFLYLHYGDKYTTVGYGQCSPNRNDDERDFFVENGLMGLRCPKTGEHLSPAAYDYIYEWGGDFDVIYTQRGKEFHYYNHQWQEILTEYRKFPGFPILEEDDEEDLTEPYFLYEKQRMPFVVSMEPVSGMIDGQCCRAGNRYFRLDRIHKSEVKGLMQGHCELQSMPDDACLEFLGPDCYIYSAFIVRSKAANPIRDCFRKLHQMCAFSGSWAFLTKVWVNSNTIVPNKELRKVWRMFLRQVGTVGNRSLARIGIGFDDTLAPGEVKMLIIRYFTDRYPSSEECGFTMALRNGTLEEFKQARLGLAKFVRKFVNDRETYTNYYYQWMKYALWYNHIIPKNSSSKLSWEQTEEKYEYMLRHGFDVKPTLWGICYEILSDYEYRGEDAMTLDELEWCSQKVTWLIKHGSDTNYIQYNGTPLDLIDTAMCKAYKASDEVYDRLSAMKDLIAVNGGKFIHQFYAEGKDPVASMFCKF